MDISGKKILLVEDEPVIAMLEQQYLAEYGINGITAMTGEDAVDKASKLHDLDMVLMDINLGPGMDGTQAAKEILKIKNLPIIFLSSHTEKEIVNKTEDITSYGYIVKDSGQTVLISSIKMAFRLHEATMKLVSQMNETENMLRNLLNFVENAPAAVAMFDRDMRYLAASRQYCHDYNLGDKDVIGKSHYEILPEIPERWKKIHRSCLNGGIESCEIDEFPRDDGSKDYVKWEIHPWRNADGSIGGIILFSIVLNRVIERYRAMID